MPPYCPVCGHRKGKALHVQVMPVEQEPVKTLSALAAKGCRYISNFCSELYISGMLRHPSLF
jgi:hypothetical protein